MENVGCMSPHAQVQPFLLIVPLHGFPEQLWSTAKISWWRSDDLKKVKQATAVSLSIFN
jgi:hypothetical protein